MGHGQNAHLKDPFGAALDISQINLHTVASFILKKGVNVGLLKS